MVVTCICTFLENYLMGCWMLKKLKKNQSAVGFKTMKDRSLLNKSLASFEYSTFRNLFHSALFVRS